jgi:hypothetical protein
MKRLGVLFAALLLLMGQSPVSDLPTQNFSVTITTGLTYQLLLAGVPVDSLARRSLTIQNNQTSGTDYCYLLFGVNVAVTPGTTTTASTGIIAASPSLTAAQASIVLSPATPVTRYYPHIPSDPLYITCTTTGDSVHASIQ